MSLNERIEATEQAIDDRIEMNKKEESIIKVNTAGLGLNFQCCW